MAEFDSGVSAGSPAASSVSPGATPDSPSGSSGVTAASPAASDASLGASPDTNAAPQTEQAVPYQRFAEVNRRMREAEASAHRWQQVQQQYGELADPQTYRNAVQLFSQLRQDPVSVATQLLSELAANEQYRPMVASQAAKVLQGLRGAVPKEEPEPQPDLMAENGAPVYSAAQQRAWLEWNQRKLQAQFDTRLNEATAPLKQMQQERAVAQVRQQAEQVAGQMYDRAQTWHGFKQHEAEIASVWNQHSDWTLQDAYLHVLHTKILPALPAQAQAKVVADLQQKAAAQSLSPSGASRPATPDFKGDFAAALKHFAR